MNDAGWPQVADKRLLKVLERQVDGSVDLLEATADNTLIKLVEILDMGVGTEVESRIIAALTHLQNIDRVMQRMDNVQSCLHDWGATIADPPVTCSWEEVVKQRYVMEEERSVLRQEL